MTKLDASAPLVGGRYAIVNFIGEGGMQDVYLAHDSVLDRDVALKTPKTVLLQSVSSEAQCYLPV